MALRLAAKESPLASVPGWSPYAMPARAPWDGKNRPPRFRNAIYGLVVHTTGSGLPSKARDQGLYPTVRAVRYYGKTHGTHYVCGWRGLDGDLIQVASEAERANGVGMRDQVASIRARRFDADLSPAVATRWHDRWAPLSSPLDLFPGSSANACYVHVEMPPCVYPHHGRRRTDAAPIRLGARFTLAQHQAVAFLACDLARRYEWPDGWWTTGRLVGHEDLSPLTRHTRAGGWDPGALRKSPRFFWDDVYAFIEEISHGT